MENTLNQGKAGEFHAEIAANIQADRDGGGVHDADFAAGFIVVFVILAALALFSAGRRAARREDVPALVEDDQGGINPHTGYAETGGGLDIGGNSIYGQTDD